MGYACKLGANNYSEKFTYEAQIVSADSSGFNLSRLVYNPKRHNKAIYTHTGTYQCTTMSIDISTQAYSYSPNTIFYSNYKHVPTFINPRLIQVNNIYAGITFSIAFKDNEVGIIAENKLPTSYTTTINCNGYKAAWINFGGNYYAGAGQLYYADLESSILYSLFTWGYGSRCQATLSGKDLTLVGGSSTQFYYSIIGIK